MTITFPVTKTTKDAIRAVIGQTVIFVIEGDLAACTTCSGGDLYDEVNEASLNPYCTECDGKYWLDSTDVLSGVVAHVRWRTQDQPEMGVGGETFGGDCFITIDVNAISASNIVKIKEVRADSRKLQIYRTIYRGVPARDRIRFVCREWGKE